MNYNDVKTYGEKNWVGRLLTRKHGYLKLGVPIVDDWNDGVE